MWKQHDTALTHLVESSHLEGLKINVRTRCDDLGREPVLCVHGATYASRFFDVPHPGANWLDALDAAGFCTYAFDVRGYGKSVDPLQELRDAPFARAGEAVEDILDVANWILDRHGRKLHIVGGSWGSITAALFTSTVGAGLVERLVLYAPIFAGNPLLPAAALNVGDNQLHSPRRRVTESDIRTRWDNETPPGAILRDERVFEALFKSNVADYEASQEWFCAPNGTLLDLAQAMSGHPLYDPARIGCPTLLLRGELDPISIRDDVMHLFESLGTRQRRYVEIGHGTHFMSAEFVGPQIFRAVASFLSESTELAPPQR